MHLSIRFFTSLRSASFNTGIIGNQFADQNSLMATYNNATGYNCKIYGYEGGYSAGASADPVALTSANGWYNWRLSSDIRYLPVWRIYEKDYYALCQTGGYTTMNLYSLYLYPSYQYCWEVQGWIGQKLGIGDGTDGKFDNRKAMQTAGLSGPNFYTAGYVGAGARDCICCQWVWHGNVFSVLDHNSWEKLYNSR